MTDYNQGTDGVGLNAAGSSGGLIATDYTEATGFFGASAHVQYTKIGFGSTHDQFFTVGDTVTNNSKPLPVMLRASDDGAAISETGNALDINIKTHGVTLQVDTLHTLGALRVEGTAGMHPLEIEGTSGGNPVWIQATGGFSGGSNVPIDNILPITLFGISSGGSGAAVGITGADILKVGIGHSVVVNNPNTTPLRIQATGGLSASSGANAKLPLDVTVPGLVMGLSGSVAAPAGMSADMIKVYLNRDAVFTQTLTGTAAVGSGTKTQPSLLFGASGPSAAVVGVTGPDGAYRLLTSMIDNVFIDPTSQITVKGGGSGGTTLANGGENILPVMLFGLSGSSAAPLGITNGSQLLVQLGEEAITLDVSLTPQGAIFANTGDDAKMHRGVQVMGMTHDSLDLGAYPPVFVSGKLDGGTYPYPIGITTAGVAGSGGQWHLHVTADNLAITRFTPTVTVSATNFNIRGLTARGGLDSVAVEGVSGSANPVFIAVTGGLSGGSNVPIHNNIPATLFGISSGGSAAAVGITGADILKVGFDHAVEFNVSSTNPLRTQATGGLSASSGNNARLPLTVTVPSLLLGLSAGSDTRAAPVGMTGDAIKVSDIDGRSAGRDSISVFGGVDVSVGDGDAGGTYNIPWVPSLVMGVSGASAAGVGMSGDALNVNMVNAGITVDVTVGTSVEVSNDTGGPLYIAGASGASGGGSLLPVTVAGDFRGNAVNIGGSAGMIGVEVRGSSAATYFPVGVTGNANYSLATDETLDSLGITLGLIRNILANALGGEDTAGDTVKNFATEETLSTIQVLAGLDNGNLTAIKGNVDTMIRGVSFDPAALDATTFKVSIVGGEQPTSFQSGQKTASTSQSALAGDVTLKSGVKVKGHQDNSGFIFVGQSASVDNETGYPLGPSEEVFLEIDNLNKIFVYASPNGTACFIGS